MYSTNTYYANNADNKENVHSNSGAWHANANYSASKLNYAPEYTEQQAYSTQAENHARNHKMFAKHAHSEEGFSVAYVDYEQLPSVVDAQVLPLIEHTRADFDSKEWLRVFHAITALRALHKSYSTQANEIFAAFDGHILSAIDSPKPCLNKNILALVYEVLSQSRESGLSTCIVHKLAEVLLRKMSAPSSMLRSLAHKCMGVLFAQCMSDSTLVKLCELSTRSASPLSKHAFAYVRDAVVALAQKVSELQPYTLQALFVSIGHNSCAGCGESKQTAREMCTHFAALMGDNYKTYVLMLHSQRILSDDYTRALAHSVAEKKPRVSFAQRQSMGALTDHASTLRQC